MGIGVLTFDQPSKIVDHAFLDPKISNFALKKQVEVIFPLLLRRLDHWCQKFKHGGTFGSLPVGNPSKQWFLDGVSPFPKSNKSGAVPKFSSLNQTQISPHLYFADWVCLCRQLTRATLDNILLMHDHPEVVGQD